MHTLLARAKNSDERERGFTLIELLVVIIVIGILAAIAIPIFLNQKKKAVDASLKSDIRNAADAVESHYADQSQSTVSYKDASDLTALKAEVTVTDGNTVQIIGDPAEGYCIRATSANSTTGTAKWYFYKSQGGGLQSAPNNTFAGCDPTDFPRATNAAGATTTAGWILI